MRDLLSPIDQQFKPGQVLSFFLWGMICLVITFLLSSYQGTNERSVIVQIEKGSNTKRIARILAEKGVVQNAFLFQILAREKKLDSRLKAGYYSFSPRQTMGQVLEKLAKGESVFYKVTIPEGYTLRQIAELLAAKGLVEQEKFLQKAKKNNFPFAFLKEAQEKGASLEGYLFPATYQIAAGASEEQIIAMMLKRFAQVADQKFQKALQGLSLHQAVTLASIVEEEAKLKEEQPLISAVFHNRLKKGMRLESCATIQYLLEQPKKRLTYQDTRISSPYNTYLHTGLPPGPISNPGKAALEAALHPAQVKYLFFVAKSDGTHYFNTDFRQHQAVARAIQREKKK